MPRHSLLHIILFLLTHIKRKYRARTLGQSASVGHDSGTGEFYQPLGFRRPVPLEFELTTIVQGTDPHTSDM